MSDIKTTCFACGAPVIQHCADEGTQSIVYDDGWVSVEDRLPEFPWVEVLVFIHATNAKEVAVACLQNDMSWVLADDSSNGADFITHWRLPEPPK